MWWLLTVLLLGLTPGVAHAAGGPLASFATVTGEPDSPYNGEYRVWRPGAGTVAVTPSLDGNSVVVRLEGGTYAAGGRNLGETLTFAAPAGERLEAKTYTPRKRNAVTNNGGTITVGGAPAACGNVYSGRFTIYDLAPDFSRLWIAFEFHCGQLPPAITGEVVHSLPADAQALVAAKRLPFPDTHPGATAYRRTVTLANTGTTDLRLDDVEITAGVGDFSIVDGSGCSPLIVLEPGGSCDLVVSFKPAAAGNRRGVLTFTDSAASKSQTVELLGTALPGHTSFSLYDQGGDYGVAGRVASYRPTNTTIYWDGTPDSVALYTRVGTGRAATQNDDRWAVLLRTGDGSPLQPGVYEDDTVAAYDVSRADDVRVVNLNRNLACTNSTGSFTIRQISFDADGALTALAGTFEQHCGGRAPATYGSIAFQADQPADLVPNAPPPPVGKLTGIGSPNELKLSWTNPTVADFREVVVQQTSVSFTGPDVVSTIYTGPGTGLTLRDLPRTGYYRFSVTPRNEARALGSASTIDVEFPKLATSGGAASVAFGSTLSYSGSLFTGGNRAMGGRTVALALIVGGKPTTVVGEALVDNFGNFRISGRPTVTGDYAVVFRGGPGELGVVGTKKKVVVVPTLTAKPNKTSATLGTTFTVTATTNPAESGAKYVLQRLDGSKWTAVSTKTSSTKSASFTVKPAKKGTTTYRVQRTGTTRYGTATSKTFTIKAT